MAKKISYLSRNYDDYRNSLVEFSKSYYPDLDNKFEDSSVGSWFLDLNAVIADELSYYIDRAVQETNIDTASNSSSVYALARNNGIKIPGPKGAMAEVKFTCRIPLSTTEEPDWKYAPIIKRGTKVSSSSQVFELLYDVNFKEQFNSEGVSDRTYNPIKNTQNITVGYEVSKLAIVVAGETKIYKKSISAKDVTPFMEILIPSEGVMNVESILVKEGSSFQSNPTLGEFYMLEESLPEKYPTTKRFFEVDSLSQQERWGEFTNGDGAAKVYNYVNEDGDKICSITKGEWKPVRHKFITEFTDNGYLKVIFGSGLEDIDTSNIQDASDFSKYQITKTLLNDALGLLPEANTTVFIMYRVGGGKVSNVALGAINNIVYKNYEMNKGDNYNESVGRAVLETMTVTNTTPSVSGRDIPSVEELKYYIKYNNGAKNRCVTIKDYVGRVLNLPPKYGTPFRVSGLEANNKVMLYMLGINADGKLEDVLPVALVKNISDYLSEYRSINDFVEIKGGRILNISVECDMFIDKDNDKSSVISSVISKIKSYFDVNKRQMGEDIFTGDLEKEIGGIDGVINVFGLRVYNETGEGYSSTQTTQEIDTGNECEPTEEFVANRYKIDLEASDGMLISDADSMFEIKYPERDIIIKVKER